MEELGDAEVFGADAVEGGDFAAEDMVGAVEAAGFFDAEDVDGAFDEAEEGVIAAGIIAKGAGLAFGEAAAELAEGDAFAGGEEGGGEGLDDGLIGLNDVEGDAFGGAGADAGQFGERGDEIYDRFGKRRHNKSEDRR